MRILHILNELNPSGAETMLAAAAPKWRAQGLINDVVSTGRTCGIYAGELEKAGYTVHHIPFSISFAFIRQLYGLLRAKRYDALHIHPERGNFIYALLGRAAHVRSIVRTVHSTFVVSRRHRILLALQRSIMRRLFKVKIVSISPSVNAHEKHVFRNPTLLIPNWFDSRRFKPPSQQERQLARSALGIPNDVTVITSIGRCSPLKNHRSIIESIARLPRNTGVMYMHVGQEEDDRPERQYADCLNVLGKTNFVGPVFDILPILHASDVYLMPSLYEGFGVSAVEAMGAGLLVILSDVPGLRDFRDAGGLIYWTNPDPDAIRNCIMRALALSPCERRKIGLEVSKYAHEHFALEIGSGAYTGLYMQR